MFVEYSKNKNGFTLVELLVAVSVIGLLSSIIYASFGESREQARDRARMSSLKQLQLSIEQYRAQNGSYPVAGCGALTSEFAGPGPSTILGFVSCSPLASLSYVSSVTPDYIDVLPRDVAFEVESNRGYYYRSDGNSYKLMAYDVVENLFVTDFTHEFARCPAATGACASGVPATTYAVYSRGAEDW